MDANGLLQSMGSGTVPGNRNADSVDADLRRFDYLVFPDERIDYNRPLKAGYLNSFGFGQAGAEILAIHPLLLWAAVSPQRLASYRQANSARCCVATQHFQNHIYQSAPLVPIKEFAPYDHKTKGKDNASARKALMNPLARADQDRDSEWRINPNTPATAKPTAPAILPETRRLELDAAAQHTLGEAMADLKVGGNIGLGVDSEPWTTFSDAGDAFLARNFTPEELSYCQKSERTAASLAGKWCAKEATLKALCNLFPSRQIASSSEAAPLKDIQVAKSKSGAPLIKLTGELAKLAEDTNLSLKASITHVKDMSTATVIATTM